VSNESYDSRAPGSIASHSDLCAARDLFPAATTQVHLNAAGIGLSSSRASDAVMRCLDSLERDPDATHHGGTADRARAKAAKFLGVEPHTVALAPSTSAVLVLAADAIPLVSGDNVVTCNLEFVSVVLPFLEKCRASGAELRVVEHDEGRVHADAVIAEIDERTRAVVLSAVLWTNGFRLDLEAVGASCADARVPLVIDGIQQVGALPLDVTRCGISFLACGGHKWLTCPSAMGFVYASDDFASRFRPTYAYAPTAVPPEGDWLTAWTDPSFDPFRLFEVPAGARRFEFGIHHAVLAAAAFEGSLDALLEVGREVIGTHVLRLSDRVADGLLELGLAVVTPLEAAHRSGITTFRAGSTASDDVALTNHLRARGIVVSTRFTNRVGGVRVSTHLYNNDGDVDTLLEETARWVADSKA
jgi:cysteine desulfurase/selenocysteine lyase